MKQKTPRKSSLQVKLARLQAAQKQLEKAQAAVVKAKAEYDAEVAKIVAAAQKQQQKEATIAYNKSSEGRKASARKALMTRKARAAAKKAA